MEIALPRSFLGLKPCGLGDMISFILFYFIFNFLVDLSQMSCMEAIKARAEVCQKWCFCSRQKTKIPSKQQIEQCLQVSSGGGGRSVPGCCSQLLIHKEAQS